MWYADASFIASAFGQDVNSAEALHWLRGCNDFPIFVSRLTLLEIDTAFRAAIHGEMLTESQRRQAQHLVQKGLLDGLLLRREVRLNQWFPQSHRIAQHASALTLCRALDVMHVAAAVILKASGFLSFDRHQRKLAEAEGLVTQP